MLHHQNHVFQGNRASRYRKSSIVHTTRTLQKKRCIVITARVRSTREGNIYTWECLSVHHWWGEGTPSKVWEVPHPRCGWEGVGRGTPSQVWVGVLYPRSGWEVPHPRSGLGVPCPRSGWGGVPHPRSGGYPIPGLNGWGVPHPRSGLGGTWGYPLPGDTPHHDWMGSPPPH